MDGQDGDRIVPDIDDMPEDMDIDEDGLERVGRGQDHLVPGLERPNIDDDNDEDTDYDDDEDEESDDDDDNDDDNFLRLLDNPVLWGADGGHIINQPRDPRDVKEEDEEEEEGGLMDEFMNSTQLQFFIDP